MAIIDPVKHTLRDGTPLTVRSACAADVPGLIALNERMLRTSPHMLRDLDELDSKPDDLLKVMATHNDHPAKAYMVAAVESTGEHAGRLAVRCGQYRKLAHRVEFGISVD